MVVQSGIVYIQSVKTELPPCLSLVALAGPEEGKLQVTKAMQNQSAWTQKNRPCDLIHLSVCMLPSGRPKHNTCNSKINF